jgi:hypothetical protein
MSETIQATAKQDGRLIRIGGLAVLVALGIHIFVNGFLKVVPPENPSLQELKDYLTAEAGTWAIVHGLKYLALVGLTVFAAGVYSRTCRTRGAPGVGWGVLGLLGTAIHVTNAMIANGIEVMAFYDFTLLSEEPSLFWLLYRTVRVLFTAEFVAWGVVIFGFSMAGFQSRTLPRWIAALGFFNATACMVSGVFVVSVLTDGWATMVVDVAALTGLAWFACVGVYMLMKGES